MSVHWGGRGAGHISRLSTATTGVPALALNFLTGTLDSSITFTRASTATFIGSNGLIQAAAINEPRFDYDPVTLAPKGLLMEEQRTNLFLNSLIDGTSLSTQTVTVTAVAHTISFYGTGTITLSGAAVAIVTGTGVYPSRKTLTFTPTAGALICTVTGSVQYAQIEVGGFATSFIPTAGTSVIRNVDSAVMTGTNFSNWYNQSEGTFVFEYSRYQNTDTFGIVLEIKPTSTSTADRFAAAASTSADPRMQLFPNGSNVLDTTSTFGVLPVNTVIKGALAYRSGSNAATRGGASPSTSATAFAAPAFTSLQIGSTDNALYGPITTTPLNGYIRQIAYYKTRLLNTQLQALTA